MEYLTESEKIAVSTFGKNSLMFNAVKKVILHGLYDQGVIDKGKKVDRKNWVFSLVVAGRANEELGARVRSCVEAYGFLEAAMDDIEKFDLKKPAAPKEGNEAE